MKVYLWIFLSLFVFVGIFFRFLRVDSNPPGLYIDEVSIGNNAYKILTTGKDEYGQQYPLFFKSLGDYKMPLYIYAVSVSMALFGKNEFAVRFPAIVSGILSIIVFYFFIKELLLLDKDKYSYIYRKYIPFLASFLLAISSWHLHFSRGGFEVMSAAFLFIVGCWLMTLFWRTQRLLFLWLSYTFYVLTIYSYHVFRIISPITIIALSILIYRTFSAEKKALFISFATVIVLSLPIIVFSFSSHGLERFSQTSAFEEYKAEPLLSKLKIYPMIYVKNYFSFYSLNFLFGGDGNGRHQVPGFGLLYRWQLPFLFVGLFYLLGRKGSKLKNVAIYLFLISPVAASFARPSPHSLRDLLAVFPLVIFIAFGLIYLFEQCRKFRLLAFFAVLVIAILEFSLYVHQYYLHYPKVNINDWGAGYKEIIEDALKYKGKYEIVLLDTNLENLNLYFSFHTEKIKPYVVDNSWKKPKEWTGEKIMLIRKFYEVNYSDKIIHNVYLPNANKDVVAQFWDIE